MHLIFESKEKKVDFLLNNQLCKEFLEELESISKKEQEIEMFCLSGNSYGTQFFKELIPYLNKIPKIKKLILNDIFTSRKEDLLDSLDLICEGFKNKGIVLFDISNNAICPDGCEKIVPLLKSNETIKYLYFNHIAMSQKGSEIIANALLNINLDLIHFELIRNRVEDKGTNFAEVIKKMKNLEVFVIFQNGMKDKAVKDLLESVIDHPKLKRFEINDNWLKEESVKVLVKLIKNTKTLVNLNIGDCNIEEENVENITNSLKESHDKWERFGYNYNEMFDEELFENFIKVCVDKPLIKEIEVMGNFFKDDLNEEIINLCEKNLRILRVEEEDEDLAEDKGNVSEIDSLISNFKSLEI